MSAPLFDAVRIDDYRPADHLLRAVDGLLDTALRKLCAGMHLNLAQRWFRRLGVDDAGRTKGLWCRDRGLVALAARETGA